MKSLDELIETINPRWPAILEAQAAASNHIEILPPNLGTRNEVFHAFQMTLGSVAGSVVYESGGILVDHGWLRVLGSGHPRLSRSVPHWTTEATGQEIENWPLFLIADDVLGGFFAVDCGALGDSGSVFYFAPDTFNWENMEINYATFLLEFCMNNDLDEYYSPYRWPNWQEEIAAIQGDQALSIIPPLCVKPFEASNSNDVWAARSRRPISVAEVFHVSMDISEQLDGLENGSTVKFRVE